MTRGILRVVLDATPFLAPERAALLELLSGLDGTGWETPTDCPGWSVKGLATHVLGDDLSLLSRQRDAAANGLLLYAGDHPGLGFRELLDGFNEQWVTAARFLSPQLVVELLVLAGEWTFQYYASLDLPAPSGEPVGFFGATGPSPWWQVVAREYVERWIHQQQIRRAIGANDLVSALSDPAMAAVVEGFGARIPGLASVHIGDAAWSFGREGEGGRVDLEPSLAVAVLSRALPIEETVAALRGPADLVAIVAAQTCRGM